MRVKDAEWSEEDFSTSGSTEAYFENIPSGATVTHSYSVTPKEAGKHHLSPLTVTYQPIAGDSKEVVSHEVWDILLLPRLSYTQKRTVSI